MHFAPIGSLVPARPLTGTPLFLLRRPNKREWTHHGGAPRGQLGGVARRFFAPPVFRRHGRLGQDNKRASPLEDSAPSPLFDLSSPCVHALSLC